MEGEDGGVEDGGVEDGGVVVGMGLGGLAAEGVIGVEREVVLRLFVGCVRTIDVG